MVMGSWKPTLSQVTGMHPWGQTPWEGHEVGGAEGSPWRPHRRSNPGQTFLTCLGWKGGGGHPFMAEWLPQWDCDLAEEASFREGILESWPRT